ncbi:MAG: UDP-N-acetylmuramate dehydrogenase [Chlorobiaceae bacterium]|nr:UDP-N-acetylmuramate dehydrogenase [Chlorobiaceae bacterium]
MSEITLPCPFERDVLLSEKAYYGIGGRATAVAYPESVSDLAELLLWNIEKRYPLVLMGASTNTLFSDEEFPGIVISFEKLRKMFWISETDLFCEAGVENTRIAEELLLCRRSGGEWLFRLPGQIGATVRMNARCFGGEISMITAGIGAIHADGRLLWHLPAEVFLGYKQTSLMDSPEIVTGVLLRFPQTALSSEIEHEMRRYEREREEKHHFDFPSCGSTFKNNYEAGRSSGRIFDELGFRGQKEGGAEVSRYHANFIFNCGGATAADVLRLAGRMRTSAREIAGVKLDLEVQCVGRFDRGLLEECGVSYVGDPDDDAKGIAGLWLHPEKDGLEKSTVYPRKLVEGPISGYFGRNREYPPGVFSVVEQLVSLEDARREPQMPLLRWTTMAGEGGAFAVKPSESAEKGKFVDGLWQFSVSELFVGRGDRQGGYLEFEMTPDAHWVALRFSSPRERQEGFGKLSAEPWEKDVRRFCDNGLFGMEFTYALLEPFIAEGNVALQCCASSGRGEYGLLPLWPSRKEPADFHQPAAFFRARLS